MEMRDYHPGDEHKILELFEITFRKKMSLDFWRWRYINNCERRTWIKLMLDDDKLVGNYSLCPVTMNYFGERTLTGLSMTTMTHPEYSGKGIFTALAKSLYQDSFARDGITFIWGFPNKNSHSGFINKLNWFDIGQIPMLSFNAIPSRFSKSNIGIKRFDAFEKQHESAYQQETMTFKIKIEKTMDYLNWRYKENPVYQYDFFELTDEKSCYFCVSKLIDSFSTGDCKEIDLVEFCMPDDTEIINGFLSEIYHHYREQNRIIKINTWLPVHNNLFGSFQKIGFTNDLPLTFFGACVLNKRFSEIKNHENWYYTMGDSDVF